MRPFETALYKKWALQARPVAHVRSEKGLNLAYAISVTVLQQIIISADSSCCCKFVLVSVRLGRSAVRIGCPSKDYVDGAFHIMYNV